MFKKLSNLDSLHWLLISMFLMATYMLIRNYGVYPSVVDEYAHSTSSRLLNINNTLTPSYLYKLFYKLTNICGAGWLECARLFNIIFYVSTAPLIYLIAKKFISEKLALYIAILSILGSASSYTAYFMTESMYFFGFWVLILGLVDSDSLISNLKILLIAVILGLLSLVKPHAFFLVIPIFIFGLYLNNKNNKNIFFWVLKFFAIILFGILTTKFFISFILSGKDGLSFFGGSYNEVGTTIFSYLFASVDNLIKVSNIFLKQIIGHWTALAIIFGPIICISINSLLNKDNKKSVNQEKPHKIIEKNDFTVLTLLMVFCMTCVIAAFTAGLGGQIEPEASRLHMRYYFFLLPMLLISGMLGGGGTLKQRAIVSAPIVCMIFWSIVTTYSILLPNYVDGPEMRGVYSNKYVLLSISILCILIIAIWVKKPKLSLFIFIFIFYPLYLIVSNIYVNIELRNRMHLSPYDRAAIFSAQFLTKNEISNMVMVGAPAALGVLALSQIYLDNPNVTVVTLPEGEIINREKLGRDYKWIVFSGDYSLSLPTSFSMKLNGFQIYRVDSNKEIIDFSSDRWPGYIDYVKGLGGAEAWGRWSRSKIVEIKFMNPLPDKFLLKIKASPYGENKDKNFVVNVGNEEKYFMLSENNQEVVMDFNNSSKSRFIKINVPAPVLEAGPYYGIGFGLINMQIEVMKSP